MLDNTRSMNTKSGDDCRKRTSNSGVPSRFDKPYHPSKWLRYYHMNEYIDGKTTQKENSRRHLWWRLGWSRFLALLCLGSCFRTRTIKHKLEQYEHVNKEYAYTAVSKINWRPAFLPFEGVDGWTARAFLAILYHAPLFHMESMWNGFIPCGIHGIHMESTWNMFHHINHVLTDMESIWNPHGIHMESTWNPHGLIPHGIHMESTWTYSTWNPHGMHLIFQLILKSDSKF